MLNVPLFGADPGSEVIHSPTPKFMGRDDCRRHIWLAAPIGYPTITLLAPWVDLRPTSSPDQKPKELPCSSAGAMPLGWVAPSPDSRFLTGSLQYTVAPGRGGGRLWGSSIPSHTRRSHKPLDMGRSGARQPTGPLARDPGRTEFKGHKWLHPALRIPLILPGYLVGAVVEE